jgi:hypothetical protein
MMSTDDYRITYCTPRNQAEAMLNSPAILAHQGSIDREVPAKIAS